jgi:lambda repressor-like predicted transcriptional regulator
MNDALNRTTEIPTEDVTEQSRQGGVSMRQLSTENGSQRNNTFSWMSYEEAPIH